MSLTIYILCGDATYNRGDRGNLTAQIDLLRSTIDGVTIYVDSYRPEVDKFWYNADRTIRRGLILSREQVKYIKKADLIVWGGGALLADNASIVKIPYWFFVIWFIRKILGKPIMAWAHGLVISSRLGKLFGRAVLNLTALVTVRDLTSFQTLKDIGVDVPPLHLTADAATIIVPSNSEAAKLIFEAEGIPFSDRPLIAICNTFCSFHYDARAVIPYMVAKPLGLIKDNYEERIKPIRDGLVTLTDRFVEEMGCNVLYIPTYPAPWENDLVHFEKMIASVKYPGSTFLLRGDQYAPKDYLSMWNYFKGVVTIPLHHAIFSTVMDVPCVSLYYEPKGEDFFAQINAKERAIDVKVLYQYAGPEHVFFTLQKSIKQWEIYRELSAEPFATVQFEARRNASLLIELVERLRLGKN